MDILEIILNICISQLEKCSSSYTLHGQRHQYATQYAQYAHTGITEHLQLYIHMNYYTIYQTVYEQPVLSLIFFIFPTDFWFSCTHVLE